MAPLQQTTLVAEGTIPLVAGAAFDTASDDAAPADDSRAPTAPLSGVAERTVDQFNDWGEGRGCNKFVPIFGGDGTKIVPTGDILDQYPGGMS